MKLVPGVVLDRVDDIMGVDVVRVGMDRIGYLAAGVSDNHFHHVPEREQEGLGWVLLRLRLGKGEDYLLIFHPSVLSISLKIMAIC